ncbi:hypothetical protein H9Y04_37395 [Streptomyces sp. TRM66268-LWL]|uniref:Integral membrane protein n=1 Tax=Streptomyces polyasparticus TaxID=2767826 RepID=A0ABR7SRT5_9ACTN|nr:hypothetical protein [Streptomyces polyasparticus]MBC9718216.1 hypothetical protein [Streptomyces polyasparticus]
MNRQATPPHSMTPGLRELYQPSPLGQSAPGGHFGLILLGSALWAVSLLPIGYVATVIGMALLWGVAADASVGEPVAALAGIVAAWAAVLTALAFAPGVRRLPGPGRFATLGAVNCLFTAAVTILWTTAG